MLHVVWTLQAIPNILSDTPTILLYTWIYALRGREVLWSSKSILTKNATWQCSSGPETKPAIRHSEKKEECLIAGHFRAKPLNPECNVLNHCPLHLHPTCTLSSCRKLNALELKHMLYMLHCGRNVQNTIEMQSYVYLHSHVSHFLTVNIPLRFNKRLNNIFRSTRNKGRYEN